MVKQLHCASKNWTSVTFLTNSKKYNFLLIILVQRITNLIFN